MDKITFVTGNSGKWRVAQDIFKKYNIKLDHVKLGTPEIQSMSVEEVSQYSAKWASEKLNIPVIKSDVGYYIDALGGFPGPFLRYANETLTSDDVLKMMEGKENRKVFLRECLTFATPDGEIKQFINEEEATISYKAYGNGTTFDNIVIFKDDKYPKSLNSEEDNFKHFENNIIIYDEMAKYLIKRD